MIEDLRARLDADPRVAYSMLFGSAARSHVRAESDVDVAVGLTPGMLPTVADVGELVSRLESVTGRTVDLTLLDEAPPALAYRIFRDGLVLTSRDRGALAARRARAILEYLDFRPIEDLCARGVHAAAARGRQGG
jgi:hypothetical protein